MITTYTPLGSVRYSNEYFNRLVGESARSCFGVAGMVSSSPAESLRAIWKGKNYPEKGVVVTQQDGKLAIELHIAISYGVNAASAAQSISHRVHDDVETATGLKVCRVTVSVDDVID